MTKSELIERLATQQSHIPAKTVEDAVKEMLEHIVKQMETERGLDRAAAIAHMRFDFIENVCDETVVKPRT